MHHWSLDADAAVVEKNISKKNLNTWYEAQQAIDRGRTKKVYCYISPKVRTTGSCTREYLHRSKVTTHVYKIITIHGLYIECTRTVGLGLTAW